MKQRTEHKTTRRWNETTVRTQDHRKTGRMKQRSEHKTTARQENETTVRTQDHRKRGE